MMKIILNYSNFQQNLFILLYCIINKHLIALWNGLTNICDDPDNRVLTNYPITIYNEDGTTYTNKMCLNCLVDTLKVSTESYYSDGKIDQNAIILITNKLSVIPSVTSKETKNGMECGPQILLGQMISALMCNDDELSELVSAWLQGVSEYTVRMKAID